MNTRLISLGTCVAAALVFASFGGRSLAASDPQRGDNLAAWAPAHPTPPAAWPDVDAQQFREEATDRQTHVLAIGANGSLELKTVSGTISCVAGSGTSATVEVIRRSRGRTEADATLGLAEVRAAVDHQGERATVTAVYPEGRRQTPYSVDVSYVVTAPAGTRIDAGSVSGDVTVRNIKGDVSASSVSGDVEVAGAAQISSARSISGDVTVTNAASEGNVEVNSVSGDVHLDQVRAQRLDAQSVSGSIVANRITVGGTNLKSVSGTITFDGGFARGGRYEFQSHSGSVQITREGTTGFDLRLSTFSGRFTAAPFVNLQNARGSFQTRVGDGSAVVVATTFSGSISLNTR